MTGGSCTGGSCNTVWKSCFVGDASAVDFVVLVFVLVLLARMNAEGFTPAAERDVRRRPITTSTRLAGLFLFSAGVLKTLRSGGWGFLYIVGGCV